MNFKENQIVKINGNDSTLMNLFNNVMAFIFPSFYEGFGLPLIEPMYLNCSVIFSDIKIFT